MSNTMSRRVQDVVGFWNKIVDLKPCLTCLDTELPFLCRKKVVTENGVL